MRALLIGLGGAGCRIVDTLNQHDQRSGVRSVRSFVFDADKKTISEMQTIPREDRFVLTPVDPVKEYNNRGTDFEVGNLASCFQRDGIEEIDAVFVCSGLGGRMAELVPIIVSQLNDTFPDPVFTILTLPGRNEGVKVSARASKTLADIRKVSQATILFDNETWFKRTEDENSIKNTMEDKHKATIYEMFPILNEMLARRVGLLLRAGEFNHKGVEAAEVVLDAGEVLNTLKETDLVAIGYATERLPTAWTNNMMKRIRVERYLLEEDQARTSRIVELAKQAVYQEVSVPCDITSSEKALVLIAGPSNELSMKGFQTVRKWIDRSIKGLEMRAGDYPVKSTQYVGVIIVLAGLGNVPRVRELDEIRTIYENEQDKEFKKEGETEVIQTVQVVNDEILFEDEMVMPIRVFSTSVPKKNEGDIFELDDFSGHMNEKDVYQEGSQVIQSPSDPRDDTSEDVIKRVDPSTPHRRQDVRPFQYSSQCIRQSPTATIFEDFLSENRSKNIIDKPKKQKRENNVLADMANTGNKNKPKDSDNVLSGKTGIGNQRPKETMVPDVLEGTVSIGTQRPKEINESAKIHNVQKPREINKSIQVTTIPLPKNPVVRNIAKKSENDK
jgi:cell division GTPase FtsZ